jgi:hypothetical protein
MSEKTSYEEERDRHIEVFRELLRYSALNPLPEETKVLSDHHRWISDWSRALARKEIKKLRNKLWKAIERESVPNECDGGETSVILVKEFKKAFDAVFEQKASDE